MNANYPLPTPKLCSSEGILDFLREWGYRTECTPWDIADLPDRARQLIRSMYLISHYDDRWAPFQAFLVELNAPPPVRRIRRTDLRTVLEPFYRRYPQGEYLFVFALPDYARVALVSPKRIRSESARAEMIPTGAATKLQLRILTLDPQHFYHTDRWVLERIRLGPADQNARAIWQKHLDAFDVERVTRRFYEGYREVLVVLKWRLAQCQVGATPAQIHAFAQQLLNRLMFLYFVQKKGWLRWDTEPDPQYLRHLWERYSYGQAGSDGFHSWLQALFLDALNKNRVAVATNPALPEDVRNSFQSMPYLDGGLFERNELDGLGFSVPDTFYAMLFDRFQGEEPGFLERYNFTVDESTPLDVEVAVDPEMLGKVYESLVAEEERHAAGIFYTPREEIDYMCRLSLIEYLHERTGYPKDDLLLLVIEPRRLLEEPTDGILPFGNLSETRQERALREVEKWLREVRVVDPAVGSGSFLVGMMKALAEIQQAIAQRLERRRFNEFDLKRRIIMENLYGVDVKDWAVRACELRLWLSLTIEAEERDIGLYTNPVLPKLSFRIRQGDSLVEEVAGVPLAMRGVQAVPSALQQRLARLAEEKARFFAGRSLRRADYIEQEEQKLLVQFLNQRIDEIGRRIETLRREPAGRQLGLGGVEAGESRRVEREAEARREARIRELEHRRQELLRARTQLTTGKTPPFFVWEVGFGEVFAEKGGFDIVIGNPPYVRQEEIGPPTEHPDDYDVEDWRARKREYKEQLARSIQALWGSDIRVDRKSDLYVYFYFTGLSLLREGGVFCFINSNSWLDVGYGAELQEFLLRRMRVLQIVDNLAERSFAQADINTVIVLLQRPKAAGPQWENTVRFVAYRKPFEEALTVPNLLTVERAAEVTRTDDLRVYPIAQRDLWLDGVAFPEEAEQAAMDFAAFEALKYEGSKWGGKYLRAPDIFYIILEKGSGKLVRLGEVAHILTVSWSRQGKNAMLMVSKPAIHCDVAVTDVLKSPKDVTKIKIGRTDARYFLRLEEWIKGQLIYAPILWVDLRGDKHICHRCLERVAFTHNFHGINPFNEKWTNLLCAVLNSALNWLLVETLGRRGLGGGAVRVLVEDLRRQFPVLDLSAFTPCQQERLLCAFDQIAVREIRSVFEELGLPRPNRDYSNIDPNDVSLEQVLPDRRALDQVVFEALGLTEEEQLEVYRAVVELVKTRMSKTRSV